MSEYKRIAVRLALFCVCGSAACLGTATAIAQEPQTTAKETSPGSATKTEPWKPEDVIYSEFAGQFRISPDGKWVVWVKSTGDKEKDARVSNLFLSSLTDNTEIQLTRGSDNNNQPRW